MAKVLANHQQDVLLAQLANNLLRASVAYIVLPSERCWARSGSIQNEKNGHWTVPRPVGAPIEGKRGQLFLDKLCSLETHPTDPTFAGDEKESMMDDVGVIARLNFRLVYSAEGPIFRVGQDH